LALISEVAAIDIASVSLVEPGSKLAPEADAPAACCKVHFQLEPNAYCESRSILTVEAVAPPNTKQDKIQSEASVVSTLLKGNDPSMDRWSLAVMLANEQDRELYANLTDDQRRKFREQYHRLQKKLRNMKARRDEISARRRAAAVVSDSSDDEPELNIRDVHDEEFSLREERNRMATEDHGVTGGEGMKLLPHRRQLGNGAFKHCLHAR
jgi:multidrug efflux pump subunit AcrB